MVKELNLASQQTVRGWLIMEGHLGMVFAIVNPGFA